MHEAMKNWRMDRSGRCIEDERMYIVTFDEQVQVMLRRIQGCYFARVPSFFGPQSPHPHST
jgi:hypothetical protein